MKSLKEILIERGATHGDYSNQARVTQSMKAMARNCHGFDNLSPAHQEALEMIFHKIARILCGNPNHRDHWDDIAGYAQLAADRVRNETVRGD